MGRGVVKDIKKGLFWLEKAASNNDVNGLFNLAQIYFQGDCVEKDQTRAAELYRKAAENGHYPSQSRLGFMFAQGTGVTKDRTQAYLWLTMAAQHGIGSALDALESMVKEMSVEEKSQGQQLFASWRAKTGQYKNQIALMPSPS
jgi:TPR repeat protein